MTGPEFLVQDPKALSDLEVVGSDTVDGVPVAHYRCEIDYSRLLDPVAGEAQTSTDETIVADLWVDADDLLRRYVLTPGFEVTSAFNLPTEGTYSDFGTDVEIEAPPADQVTEDLAGAG